MKNYKIQDKIEGKLEQISYWYEKGSLKTSDLQIQTDKQKIMKRFQGFFPEIHIGKEIIYHERISHKSKKPMQIIQNIYLKNDKTINYNSSQKIPK